jgi:hypothetical protein
MTQLVSEKSLAYIFSSDNSTNPINKSADGTIFSVQLDHPISLPRAAYDCTLEVVSARCWNTVPNISAKLRNNNIRIITANGTRNIVIADGLYSVGSLSEYIQNALVNLGEDRLTLYITGNFSTQQSVLNFGVVGTQVDFTIPNSVRGVLGFNARLAPVAPSTIVGQTDSSDNIAQFNNIENFLIKSDIVNSSIPTNNQFDQTIAYIAIKANPGSQIISEPINPIRIDASNLKTVGRNCLTFRLTNQAGAPAETGEAYGLTIVIRWKEFASPPQNY